MINPNRFYVYAYLDPRRFGAYEFGGLRFELDAYDYESTLIKLIGRRDLDKGPLTNQNDGGENNANVSQEIRQIISQKIKSESPRYGIPCTEENKKKYHEIHKGKRYSKRTEFKKGFTPWNKGLKGAQKAWNKGLKKEDYAKR